MKIWAFIMALVLVIVLIVGAFYVFGNGSASPSTGTQVKGSGSGDFFPNNQGPGTDTNSSTSVPKTYTMDIKGFAFQTQTLNVHKGDTIVWTNQDSAPHTVTSQSGSELDSPTLSKGQTYSHTFNSIGTFDYYCTVHPMMKAKVVVSL